MFLSTSPRDIVVCRSNAKRNALKVAFSAWLQAWMAGVQASRDTGISAAAVAAAAMFVLVVTRTNDQWASWSEHDNMFVRHGVSSHSTCLHALFAVT